MSRTFTLTDSLALRDLQIYLGRAARIEEGSVRLIAADGVLAVYTAILYPIGLLDEAPTVLGLRTFAVHADETFDAVVPIRSLTERLTRLIDQVTDDQAEVTVTLPIEVNTVTWAAISPPKGGWVALPPTGSTLLDTVARAGIDEVAAVIPTGTGEQIVHRVRSEVWGRPIDELEHVPAGAGFAALSLGFLGDSGFDDVRIFETGPWTRLTTERGHVLIKRKPWRLAR
ncbi:hypothetical protein [Galbitalea soli]|uniref:Uncharacterized protein n=1 Tax=Galbitalea soli TaxID=1268042 RepID=A0A7C9PNG1_9MICO|nr:hypothetical protein [Galbitalea soli]NEM91673.1 hypothetical protein [Galbitalea soli]NYJ30369.1 hypothetical protein [Galbitalea soli]